MASYANILVDMGFALEKVNKAIEVTGNQGVEPAMEWLLAHGDDIEVSQAPSETVSGGETVSATVVQKNAENAKSIKCEECNKLFTTQLEVEFHASKTNHSNFSESTEEKQPLTEEQKKEQLALLEQKLKEKKKEREEKEKAEALEREKSRVKTGKEYVAIRKQMEDEELKKAVAQRKKEKEDDRLARERIKEQIERDKLDRKAKFGSGGSIATTPVSPTAPLPSVKSTPKDYTHTRLQIRLTNGSTLTQQFHVKEQLSAVRLYIEINRTDGSEPFNLMTTFPRKVFTEDDYDKPLESLGLIPSAVVIVSKVVD